MPVVLVGLNHRSAPLDLLEQLTIADDLLPKALHQAVSSKHVSEAVVLSTCNRVEVYAVVPRFHAGAQELRNFLGEFGHVAPEDLSDHLYTFHDDAAIRHLFRVASGIDSMIVGESEILGQVRRAYQTAQEEGAAGRVLNSVFQTALKVGKRARTETSIGRHAVSVSSAAVELAKRALPGDTDHPLAGKRVLIVGAGEMGRLAAQALAQAGATEVTVVSRTEERAEALARSFGARFLPLDQLGDALRESDIVLSSTASTEPVITSELLNSSRLPDTHPLLIIDIAVPRDVDPAVAELPGVVLRDIDDLKDIVRSNLGERLGEVEQVEQIVSEEVERFAQRNDTVLAPAVGALVDAAEAIRREELAAFAFRLERLGENERVAVDHLTRRIVAKLLHTPIEALRGGSEAATLGDLYGPDHDPGA